MKKMKELTTDFIFKSLINFFVLFERQANMN